ncbi:MAG TPA: hypothetical protein VJ372_22225 [Pyrinomonadaceae bacterium]|jgi:hypothetical protein|nr:hypothetical protein [Pyrinomonadaceae bacterium]
MKILSSALVLFLFAVCASAQSSSAPPDVTVLQNKWRIDLYNPALDKDPLAASKEHQQEEIQQQAAARENENRIRHGEPALPPVVRKSAPDTGDHRLTAFYVYELKVRNTGQQEIRTLTWEYVFFEPGTTREMGRLRFVSKVDMRPGTTKHLVVRSKASPTGSLDAAKAGKNTRDQYSEQVVIRSLEYADGSVWSSVAN